MAIVYLLSASEYKDRTAVHGNVDDKIIKSAILDCQEMYVERIIGSGIYDEIITQVQNSTLTALNTTLLNDYIQKGMRPWVTSRLVKKITFRFMDIGVQTKDSDNTQPIDYNYVQTLEDYYLNESEYYAQRITDYLCENSASYPLYENPGDGVDVIHPTRKNYRSGLWIPRRRHRTGLDSFSDREHYEN